MKYLSVMFLSFFSLIFAEVPINWGSSQTISTPTTEHADSCNVAGDSSGNFIMTWSQEVGGTNYYIKASYSSDSGATWSAPANISGIDCRYNGNVVMDESGNAIAIWAYTGGSYDRVQVSYSSDYGANWSAPQTLSADGQNASSYSVVMDETGHGIIIWRRSDGSNRRIQETHTSDYGANWSAPITLSPSEQTATTPQIVMDITGHAIIIWSNSTAGYVQEVYTSDYAANWSSVSNLAEISIFPFAYICMDRSGHAIFSFTYGDDVQNFVTKSSVSSDYGATWSAASTVSSYARANPVTEGMFTGSGAGNAVLFFTVYSATFSSADLYSVRSSDYGATWSTPLLIYFTSSSTDDFNIILNVGSNDALVSWKEEEGVGYATVKATNTSDYGVNWSSVQTISPVQHDLGSLTTYIYGTGNNIKTIAAWKGEVTGVPSVVQYITGTQATKTSTLNITSSEQQKRSFPWEVDLVNQISWSPPTVGDPVYYKIYADSAKTILLETFGADDFSYENHRRKKGTSNSYWLTWTDLEGYESTPVEVTLP